MADREPFTQRMNPELYERLESTLAGTNRSKADAFDEMLRWWLWTHGDGEPEDRLDRLVARQEEILALLRDDPRVNRHDAGGDAGTPVSPAGEPLGGPTPKGAVTVTSLDEYDSDLPARYVLGTEALRELPDRMDEGTAVDPAHLEIDRYPRPVRVKKCICVAVLRYERDDVVTKDEVWKTIKRVLGTTRYANRYLSNVLELLDGPYEREGQEIYRLHSA